MAKTSYYIRKSSRKSDTGTIGIRIREGKYDLKIATPLTVQVAYWDASAPGYRDTTPVAVIDRKTRREFNRRLILLANFVEEHLTDKADNQTMKAIIEEFFRDNACKTEKPQSSAPKDCSKDRGMDIREAFKRYLKENSFSKRHMEQTHNIERKVIRFIDWQRDMLGDEEFSSLLDDIDTMLLSELRDYIAHERIYYKEYPDFYNKYDIRFVAEISPNTLTALMARFTFVLNWCVKQGYMTNLNFKSFDYGVLVYGSPYYLTLEERDTIFYADLTGWPKHLVENRDKFMFQCLVGCRLSDLNKLTKANVKGDFLEYIPQKSLNRGIGSTVRVPLNSKAKELLARQQTKGDSLFPYHCRGDYNSDIRLLLHLLGINRVVTILNRHTHKEEQHPLYELATSHLGRRTFIGNLYKKVKDQELIASMTGHSQGSKAFARYRHIDEDMKNELVSLID